MELPTNTAEQLKMLRVQLLVRIIFRDTVMQYYTVLCMASNNVGLVGFLIWQNHCEEETDFSLEIMFVEAKQLWRGEHLSVISCRSLTCWRVGLGAIPGFSRTFRACLMGSWYSEATERFAVIFS